MIFWKMSICKFATKLEFNCSFPWKKRGFFWALWDSEKGSLRVFCAFQGQNRQIVYSVCEILVFILNVILIIHIICNSLLKKMKINIQPTACPPNLFHFWLVRKRRGNGNNRGRIDLAGAVQITELVQRWFSKIQNFI